MEVVPVLGEDLASLIAQVAHEHNMLKYTIADVRQNKKGEGFLGQIFWATVQDSNSERKLDLVIKVAFVDDNARDAAPIRLCFENESCFYSEVFVAFKKFETERGAAVISRLVPKCFKFVLDDHKEMIVLENLKVFGFEIFDKTLTLDHDHVSLIFKTYGRLHAYSFAMRDQQPEVYNELTKKLHNVFHDLMTNEKRYFRIGMKTQTDQAADYLIKGEDDHVITKFAKYKKGGLNEAFIDIVGDTDQYSVILHGDSWSNNILFRYDDNKKPIELRLIDWQLLKVGSPVCDLSYCLYTGASKAILDKFHVYLKIYHESLSSFLVELGSNPEKIFPFDVLLSHWRKYARFGMAMAIGILKVKLTNSEDIVDLTDGLNVDDLTSAVDGTKFNEAEYKKRLRDVLQHMCETDCL